MLHHEGSSRNSITLERTSMKNTVTIIALLTASHYATLHCMDEKNKDLCKPLLDPSSTAINHEPSDTSSSQSASANINPGPSSNTSSHPYLTMFDDIERGVDEKEVIAKTMRAVVARLPQPTDYYTGGLYPANSTTYIQFWQAYQIPERETYRSSAQLDEYVRNRQQQAAWRRQQEAERRCGECCSECCHTTAWCLCGAATIAGVVTGMVYLFRWEPSCDQNPYQSKCYDYSDSSADNSTFVTDLIKKMQ